MVPEYAKMVAEQIILGAALTVSEDKKISLEEAEALVVSKADIPRLEQMLEGASTSCNALVTVHLIGEWFGEDLATRI